MMMTFEERIRCMPPRHTAHVWVTSQEEADDKAKHAKEVAEEVGRVVTTWVDMSINTLYVKREDHGRAKKPTLPVGKPKGPLRQSIEDLGVNEELTVPVADRHKARNAAVNVQWDYPGRKHRTQMSMDKRWVTVKRIQ